MTHIILVRHGETDWNREEHFRGRADVPLNQTGLGQAEATGRRIAGEWHPVAIYSSPLSRAVMTAEAIARHFNLEVQLHLGLMDIHYGQWEGLTPNEVRKKWPREAEAWYNTPHKARIPGGETLEEVKARALNAVRELVSRHEGQTIVIVSHTVVNRIILLAVLGLGHDRFWRLRQDTCAVNLFEAGGDLFTLELFNDNCHLHGDFHRK